MVLVTFTMGKGVRSNHKPSKKPSLPTSHTFCLRKAQIGTRGVPGLVAQLGSKPRYPDLWSSFLSKTIRVGKMRDIHSHPLGSLRDVGICRGILEVWGQYPNFWLWNISRRPRTSLAHTADLQGKREVERSLDTEKNREAQKREI